MSPWLQFKQPSCYPNECMCEFARDALIRQPSAFWSSLSYFFLAYWFYREQRIKTFDSTLWAAVIALLGFSSLVGHGTFTQFGLSMDFAAIILIISFFGLIKILNRMENSKIKTVFLLGMFYVATLAGMYFMDKWSRIGVSILVFFFTVADVIVSMGASFLKARLLQSSLIILVTSFGLFLLDELHIVCEPMGLWHLHSVWHLGTAISIYLYGKWRFSVR